MKKTNKSAEKASNHATDLEKVETGDSSETGGTDKSQIETTVSDVGAEQRGSLLHE